LEFSSFALTEARRLEGEKIRRRGRKGQRKMNVGALTLAIRERVDGLRKNPLSAFAGAPPDARIPPLTWQPAKSKIPAFLPPSERPMILTINRSQLEPDIDVLEMNGRIVLGNDSRAVEWKFDELLKENRKKVIFDLGHVTVLDSTGVGIVVMCYARLKKSGGALHIAGANGMVEQTLRMTNVDRLIELYPSVSEAAAAFPTHN
jgi:anti-sigma B factor antagonist